MTLDTVFGLSLDTLLFAVCEVNARGAQYVASVLPASAITNLDLSRELANNFNPRTIVFSSAHFAGRIALKDHWPDTSSSF
jgi:hypothetical protein